jgi:hypothetical protein
MEFLMISNSIFYTEKHKVFYSVCYLEDPVSVFSSMATIQGNCPKRVLVLVLIPMMRVEVAVTPSGFTTPQPGYT